MPTQEQGMVTIDDGYDCLKQCFNEKISNWLWLGASEHKKWISRAFIYSRPTSDNNPVFLSPLSFSVYLALWTIVDWSIWARKWTDIDTITSVLSYCNVEISTELLALALKRVKQSDSTPYNPLHDYILSSHLKIHYPIFPRKSPYHLS